jgi:glycosyltransferase involved in cell wall biosynthesis
MERSRAAIVHYSAPPVVGGVEAVILAQVSAFVKAGYPVSVVAGRGREEALPSDAGLQLVPLMDSLHPKITAASEQLEEGTVPSDFDDLVNQLIGLLAPALEPFDNVIIHNVFTKHFNLPLTAALHYLLDAGELGRCIAWCHDFTWTSPHSRSRVHPGYPWDLLRTRKEAVTYVAVSARRQRELAALFQCDPHHIQVIYNGVSPEVLLGLSPEGSALVERLGLLDSDLVLLMPVRVTQAKNIELALRVVAALKAQNLRPRLILSGPPDPHDAQSMDYYQGLKDLRQRLDVEQEMRFVFESGPDPAEPFTIDMPLVGELFRASDVVFMPSRREGFGMPVLEAGLVGMPVVSTQIPAAEEIGGEDVLIIDPAQDPGEVAQRILTLVDSSPVQRLRRRVRQRYTWHAIFERDVVPLLAMEGAA